MRAGLALLVVVLLAAVSCAAPNPLPSYEVTIQWPGSTGEGGEDFPPEYEAWYSVKAFAIGDVTLTEYSVADSFPHEGSTLHQQNWILPDDSDYYATVETHVKIPGGIVVATCKTDTVDVFVIEAGDCEIVPREE